MYHLKQQRQPWFLLEEAATPASAPGLPCCGEELRGSSGPWLLPEDVSF